MIEIFKSELGHCFMLLNILFSFDVILKKKKNVNLQSKFKMTNLIFSIMPLKHLCIGSTQF